MRGAFRALHALERQVLAASQRSELQSALMRIDGEVEARRGALLAAARGRFAGMMAALPANLSAVERFAALERIRAEEAAELAIVERDLQQDRARWRRTVAGSVRRQQRAVRTALGERQKSERSRLDKPMNHDVGRGRGATRDVRGGH